MLTQRQLKVLIIGLVVVGAFAFFLIIGSKPTPNQYETLTLWGLDAPDVWTELSAVYKQQTGNTLVYTHKNPATYERELIDALAGGSGPDLFYFADTWLAKHWSKVTPAPSSVFDANALKERIVNLAATSYLNGSHVYAMPLFVDTLAMFYNQSLLDQGAIAHAPKTWDELASAVPKLTKLDSHGTIAYAGVALGSGPNVTNASDILALLMMQFGSPISSGKYASLNDQEAARALAFYVQFAKLGSKTYTWDQSLDPSLETFAHGKAAIIFGYAADIAAIRKTAPYFTFKIAPMLQLKSSELRTDFGRSWGLAVSRQSNKATTAWNLIKIVTSPALASTYSLRTNLPPAQRDVLNQLLGHITLGTFSRQAFTAVNWAKPDTNAVDMLFSQTIDAVLANRQSATDAVNSLKTQLNRLFDALP
jgi:multiple sugar transport system substrate-binding protein